MVHGLRGRERQRERWHSNSRGRRRAEPRDRAGGSRVAAASPELPAFRAARFRCGRGSRVDRREGRLAPPPGDPHFINLEFR